MTATTTTNGNSTNGNGHATAAIEAAIVASPAEKLKPEQIVLQRGSATLGELGLDAQKAIELAKKTPTIEPVFLVKFRSRQGKTRVEEIRAYAWPGQKIALAHMGYRADDARLLRLEVRQPAQFPGRLFARFEKNPKQLEELRATAKLYEKAMKQAPSKPGRAERDVLPLVNAFKKLGSDVAIEMLIDTASIFQGIDNATYASKMLGNLLKLVQKDKTVDISLLSRTVLAAADDGVFNAHLYEFTWQSIAKKQNMKTALGFGLRVFRRLMTGGRAIPGDFVKVLRKAAALGKVTDFEPIFDSTVVWAAGIPSFWNTSKKTASWRDEQTGDHAETQLLRARLRDLWIRAGAEGEAGSEWKREIWGRIQASMPELTSYGRMLLTENLLTVTESSSSPGNLARLPDPPALAREEGEYLLEAALGMLVKPPKSSDRTRVENAGNSALFRLANGMPDLLWNKTSALEDALRTATGNLTSFVALYDLASDVSEVLGEKDGKTLLRAVDGLEAAFTGALVAALEKTEKERDEDDDDYYYDDSDDDDAPPVVTLLGEALTLFTPQNAPEHLSELGKLVASRLSKDLTNRGAVLAWERVLGSLHALGPVGGGIAADATARFVKNHKDDENISMAAPVAHLLDGDALRRAAESRRVVEEVLEIALNEATPEFKKEKVLKPVKELNTDSPHLCEIVPLGDGTYRALWTDNESTDDAKAFAVTKISNNGLEQEVVLKENIKGLRELRLWATAKDGLRIMTVKDRAVALYDETWKQVGKLNLPEDFKGSWGLSIHLEKYHALFEQSEEVVVVDTSLKGVAEISGKGWGRWWISESPDGVKPPIIVHQGSPLNALYLEGKRIPPPKFGDLASILTLARTEDGAWWMDYRAKKTKVIKRATWDEASSAWKSGPATLPESHVIDFGGFEEYSDQRKTIDRKRHRGYAFEGGELVVKDALGVDLAAAPAIAGVNAQCVDLETGVVITPEEILIDPSLSARIDASRDLRAAILPDDSEVLPRALYNDRPGLVKYVRNALESREAGKKALETLGEYADPLFDAAIVKLMGRLTARLEMLNALDGEKPETKPVPKRVPGVGRTALRRLVRTHVKGNAGGFVFWSLDGNDPSPVIEYLKNDPSEAMPLAFNLLALAQNPTTDKILAGRLLVLISNIAKSVGDPSYVFEIDTEDHNWIDDDDSLATGRKMGMLVLNENAHESLRNRPAKTYGKNEAPLEWTDDAEERSKLVKAWLAKEWGMHDGGEVTIAGKNDENGRVFRLPLASSGGKISIDVSLVWSKKVGFKWELTEVSGKATGGEFEATFVELEKTSERLGAEPMKLYPGHGLMRADTYETVQKAVGFTRDRLDNREKLRPMSWEAPPVKGAEDPKTRLWVMLAWLFGGVHYDTVNSTRKNFQNLATKCKLVTANWYGLSPAVGKKKGEYDDADDSDGHPELVALRPKTFLRMTNERNFDSLVILDDPTPMLETYKRLVGASAGDDEAEEEKPEKAKAKKKSTAKGKSK